MSRLDIWLCKVLLHTPALARLPPREHQTMMARIVSGDIGALPDGTIIEPVKAFASEPEAHAERERRLVDEPGADYRVIVAMDVAR